MLLYTTIMNKESQSRHTKRVSIFLLIGAGNTLVDFVLLNILNLGLNWPIILANLVSGSVGVTLSFILNSRFVFKPAHRSVAQIYTFILVTAFGLYVLQNLVIYLLIDVWPAPLKLADRVQASLGLPFSSQFVMTNGAKAIATVVSLTWNYVCYDRIVFKAKSDTV